MYFVRNIINNLDISKILHYTKTSIYIHDYFDTPIKLLKRIYDELKKFDISVNINQNFFPTDLMIMIYSKNLTNYTFQNDILKWKSNM